MPVLKNQRHEAFARALAKGKTTDDAYISAGYKPNRGNAARLKANEDIRGRVAELLSKAAERTVTTVEDIARQLDEDRTFARGLSAPSAAVSATMGKAKVLGLIVDKREHSGPGGGPIPTMTLDPEVLKAMDDDELAALERAIGKLQRGDGGGPGGAPEAGDENEYAAAIEPGE